MNFTRQIRHVATIGNRHGAPRALRAIGTRVPVRAMTSALPRARRIPSSLWLGLAGLVGAVLAFFAFRPRILGVGGRRVEDVMIRDVVTLPLTATLLDAAQAMRDANIGVLPVIAGGILRGVITDRDLVVRAMARGIDPVSAKIGDFVTTDVVCAHPNTDVDEAMQVMAHQQIGRLPIIDDDNRLVGMVTLSSLALRSTDEDEALDTAKEVSRRSARAA